MARVLLYGVALVVALLLIGADFVWRHAEDAPPAGAPDLTVEPTAPPSESNGLAALERAADALAWPDADPDPTWLNACIDEGACPTEAASRLLARNERALALLEPALAAPVFHTPPMRTVASDTPNMLRWMQLAKLLAVRTAMRSRTRDPRALDSAIAAVRFGQRVEADPSAVLIHAMVGLRIKRFGLRAFVGAAPRLDATPEASLRMARDLEVLRTDPEAWRAMWSTEYRVVSRSGTDSELPKEFPRWLPEDYVFHPSASWNLYADRIRAFRAVAGEPCSALPPTSPDVASPVRRFLARLRPNGVGRLVVADGVEQLATYEQRRCGIETRIGVAQVLLALRAYEVESGALPERLDALVPRFLDAVPVEWFYGTSLESGYLLEERFLSWFDGDETYYEEKGARRAPLPEISPF